MIAQNFVSDETKYTRATHFTTVSFHV